MRSAEMTNNGIYFSGASSEPLRAPRAVRVLVVDDDADAVSTLVALLREEGFEAQGALSGKGALAAIRDFDPDALFLDIALKDLSGWDVARQIRKDMGDARPLIVAITGQYKLASDRILAEMAGFNHYILKPYDPNALLRLLAPLTQLR